MTVTIKESIEIWYDLPDYPGYSITKSGKVKRNGRPTCAMSQIRSGRKKYIDEKIISQRIRAGYLSVNIRLNKKPVDVVVHRLLCKMFVPNIDPQNKIVVNHKNGIKTDNRLENLEWVTHQENCAHAIYNGFTPSGSRHRWAKLNETDVSIIQDRIKQGFNSKEIAKEFKVCRSTVYAIKTGQNWNKTRSNNG